MWNNSLHSSHLKPDWSIDELDAIEFSQTAHNSPEWKSVADFIECRVNKVKFELTSCGANDCEGLCFDDFWLEHKSDTSSGPES